MFFLLLLSFNLHRTFSIDLVVTFDCIQIKSATADVLYFVARLPAWL